MGNLVEIKRDYLFNTLSAEDIGVYPDTDKEKNVLFVRKFGLSLYAGEKSGYTKSSSQSGRLKVSLYKLNTDAPQNTSEYEETITIDPRRKSPGVNEVLYRGAATYGGTYNVSVSNGVITSASIDAIINNIASQIYSDPNAIVEAGYSIHVTGYTDGDTININGHGNIAGADLNAHINLINASGYAKAFKVPNSSGGWESDEYILIFKEKFDSVVGAALDLTDAGYLGVAALDVDTSFEPKFINVPDEAYDIDNGLFPFLTSKEVRSVFVNSGNHGILSSFANNEKAIAGADYTKYTIWTTVEAYDNQTPGGMLSHTKQFHLYILTSLLSGNIWDNTDLNAYTGITPNISFDELLDAWLGSYLG